MLALFQSADVNRSIGSTVLSPNNARWRPPDENVLKLNTDASFFATGAGYGYVLRDSVGMVLKSGASPLCNMINAEHAEIMAFWPSVKQILTNFRILGSKNHM